MWAPLVFKFQLSGDLYSWYRTPRMGAQCGAWTPHSSVRTSAVMISLLFVGLPWGCGSWLDYISSPPTCGSVFISLVVKIFSTRLQVIFIDSCSVSTCNFGVPVGGGEFRVFLLCYLDLSPFISFSCFIALAKTSNTMLNRSDGMGMDVLAMFTILGEKHLIFCY